jgi:hypothetical protein
MYAAEDLSAIPLDFHSAAAAVSALATGHIVGYLVFGDLQAGRQSFDYSG